MTSGRERGDSGSDVVRATRRDVLLDAVERLVADREWSNTTLTDVARVAGVSRQTVYNEFGSREATAQAFVLREVDRFLGRVEAAIVAHADDPLVAVRAGLTTFLVDAADSVVVKAVVSGHDGGGLLPLITTQGAPVVNAARERVGAVLVAAWPASRTSEVTVLADALVRLAISHAAQPAAPPEHAAGELTELLSTAVLAASRRAGNR